MKKFSIILMVLVVISVMTMFYLPGYLSASSLEAPTEVVVPKGASLSYVSELLYSNGVIKSKLWFNYQAKANNVDRNIKPGTYTIEPSMNLEEIFQLLQKGEQAQQLVLTIPEGFTLYQIAQRVESLGLATVDEFIASTKDYYREKGFSFNTSKLFYELEGYLYPDTYYFNPNQTSNDIVLRMGKQMEDVFTEEYKNRAKELNLSTHEVLTIASLIEREAYHDQEKKTISGVIYNRLKQKMLLQIDATVIYAIGEGKEHVSRVLYAHLESTNSFNTYKHNGLPPGPIAAPGKKAIEAALFPEDHQFMYYVLGENGHVFSKTYSEHQVNVKKYRNMVNN